MECLDAMRLQMMHTLLPGGLLLHADAPKAFCSQLQSEGTLPLMKVNMDASSAAKRLEVSFSHISPASSTQHAQMRPSTQCIVLMLCAPLIYGTTTVCNKGNVTC